MIIISDDTLGKINTVGEMLSVLKLIDPETPLTLEDRDPIILKCIEVEPHKGEELEYDKWLSIEEDTY